MSEELSAAELRKAAAVELAIKSACEFTDAKHGRDHVRDDIAWTAGYRAAQLMAMADIKDNQHD